MEDTSILRSYALGWHGQLSYAEIAKRTGFTEDFCRHTLEAMLFELELRGNFQSVPNAQSQFPKLI